MVVIPDNGPYAGPPEHHLLRQHLQQPVGSRNGIRKGRSFGKAVHIGRQHRDRPDCMLRDLKAAKIGQISGQWDANVVGWEVGARGDAGPGSGPLGRGAERGRNRVNSDLSILRCSQGTYHGLGGRRRDLRKLSFTGMPDARTKVGQNGFLSP